MVHLIYVRLCNIAVMYSRITLINVLHICTKAIVHVIYLVLHYLHIPCVVVHCVVPPNTRTFLIPFWSSSHKVFVSCSILFE